jgi:hypothetical protein
MFVRLQVASRRPQVLLAKWVAAWRLRLRLRLTL